MPQESPTLKEQLAITVPYARAGRKGAGSDPGPGRRPGSVYFESLDEGQTIRDPATVAKIILTFDTLRSVALPRGASRDLIVKVAEEYGRDLA